MRRNRHAWFANVIGTQVGTGAGGQGQHDDEHTRLSQGAAHGKHRRSHHRTPTAERIPFIGNLSELAKPPGLREPSLLARCYALLLAESEANLLMGRT